MALPISRLASSSQSISRLVQTAFATQKIKPLFQRAFLPAPRVFFLIALLKGNQVERFLQSKSAVQQGINQQVFVLTHDDTSHIYYPREEAGQNVAYRAGISETAQRRSASSP